MPAQGRAARPRRRQPAGRRPATIGRPACLPSVSRRGCSRPSSPSTGTRSGWPITSPAWRARSGSCTAWICPATWSPGSSRWLGRRRGAPAVGGPRARHPVRRRARRVRHLPGRSDRGWRPARSRWRPAAWCRGGTSGPIAPSSQAAEELTAPALPYFLDPAGRVAETSRGNLFVQGADGVWRTPPADEHVLPGVTRRALLDELGDRGVPVEIAPVTADDLGGPSRSSGPAASVGSWRPPPARAGGWRRTTIPRRGRAGSVWPDCAAASHQVTVRRWRRSPPRRSRVRSVPGRRRSSTGTPPRSSPPPDGAAKPVTRSSGCRRPPAT